MNTICKIAVLSNKLSWQEMKMATQVQILDKAVYVSLCANALGKGMNPFLLLTRQK